MICGWVIEGVVIASSNADHAALGHGLFGFVLAAVIGDLGVNLTAGQLQPELTTAAGREQTVDVETCESIHQDQR